MKIDTPEKYKARQERRRRKAQHSVQLATEQPRALDRGLKPDHKARAVSIGMITEAIRKEEATHEDQGNV